MYQNNSVFVKQYKPALGVRLKDAARCEKPQIQCRLSLEHSQRAGQLPIMHWTFVMEIRNEQNSKTELCSKNYSTCTFESKK